MEFKKIQNNSLSFNVPPERDTEILPSKNNSPVNCEEKNSPINPEFWQNCKGVSFKGQEELNKEILDFAEKLRQVDPRFYTVKKGDKNDKAIELAKACFDKKTGKIDENALKFIYKYSLSDSLSKKNATKFQKFRRTISHSHHSKLKTARFSHCSNSFKNKLPDTINYLKDNSGSINSENVKYMSKLVEFSREKCLSEDWSFFDSLKNKDGVVEKEYFDFALNLLPKVPKNTTVSEFVDVRRKLGKKTYKRLEKTLSDLVVFSSVNECLLGAARHCIDKDNVFIEDKMKIMKKAFETFDFFTATDEFFEAIDNEENAKMTVKLLEDYNLSYVTFSNLISFINKFKDSNGKLGSFAKEKAINAVPISRMSIAMSVFGECVSDKSDTKNNFDFVNFDRAMNIYNDSPRLFNVVGASKLVPLLKKGFSSVDLNFQQKTILHKSLINTLNGFEDNKNEDYVIIKKIIDDLDIALIEDNRQKALKILKSSPELEEKIDVEKLMLFLKGDITEADLEFKEKAPLYQALLNIAEDGSNRSDYEITSLHTLIESLNKGLSFSNLFVDISKEDKIDFANSVLTANKIDNSDYSQFENVIKDSISDFKKMDKGVPLKYSREEFLFDLNLIFDSKKEAICASKKFGINFVFDKNGDIQGYEGIILFNKAENLNEKEKQMLTLCEKFILDNEARTDNEKLNKEINNIIKGAPEFINIIGKKQHGTHKYTLDIHSLLVLANSINNPDYLKLRNIDKIALKTASLLHDIDKHEGIIDMGHQNPSALLAKNIVQKFFPNEEFRDRIYGLIKNHHWLAEYNLSTDKEPVAEKYAFEFRRPYDYEIAKILARSDLMGVSDEFYEGHKNALDAKKLKLIDNKLFEFYSNGCTVFSDVFTPRKTNKDLIQTLDGKNYTVINLHDIKQDETLFDYGFSKGSTKKNINFLVHMVDGEKIKNSLNTVKLLSNSADNAVLSESLITPLYSRTYQNRKYGVLLSQINSNVINLNPSNQSSGAKKNAKNAIYMLFDNDEGRKNYKYSFLKKLNINPKNVSDVEYADFYKKNMASKTSISQFADSKFYRIGKYEVSGKEIKNAINKLQNELIDKTETIHNEILGFSPKINAVIAKEKTLKDVNEDALEFAYENDLPIILM